MLDAVCLMLPDDAEDATSYNIRGRAYLKLGNTDRGLDDLEKGGQLEAARCV
jgi:hypothetical protein